MRKDRYAFPQQSHRFPVNGGDHLERHERETGQHPGHGAAVERLAAQAERGVEHPRRTLEHVEMHRQMRTWRGGMPAIAQVHRHERRNVHGFRKFGALVARLPSHVEDVADLLAPGGVGHFGDQQVEFFPTGLKTIIDADRVDAVAEVAQVGQQADRALRATAGLSFRQIAHVGVQRDLGIAEMILATEPGQSRPAGRPQPAAPEHGLQFRQIEVGHEQVIAKLVPAWQKAPVPDMADVEATVQMDFLHSM